MLHYNNHIITGMALWWVRRPPVFPENDKV